MRNRIGLPHIGLCLFKNFTTFYLFIHLLAAVSSIIYAESAQQPQTSNSWIAETVLYRTGHADLVNYVSLETQNTTCMFVV